MNCYYVVASLPTLALGEPPPFPVAEVPRRLANVLEDPQKAMVEKFVMGRESEVDSPFVRRWLDLETQIRNVCAKVRAGRRGVESRPFEHPQEGYAVWIERAVHDAFARPNPLEREMSLDRLRWRILDELTVAEPFGFNAVLAWILKLRLVERWNGWRPDAGQVRFEEAVSAIRAQSAKGG